MRTPEDDDVFEVDEMDDIDDDIVVDEDANRPELTFLIEQAQSGDYVAIEQLHTLFRFMIVKIANDVYYNTGYNGLEIEDLRSVGQASFYEAVKSFRTGSSPFPAYAKLVVERGIRNCSKEHMGLGRQFLNNAISLDTPIGNDDSSLVLLDTLGEEDAYIAATILKDDDLENMNDYFETHFNPKQTKILRAIFEGYNNEEIIKAFHVSRKAYYYELKKIRHILENK